MCLHNDYSPTPRLLGALSMPAVILCWGTADTQTHMEHRCANMSHPLCFNLISQRCVSVSSCRTVSEWCVWASCDRVRALCDLCSLSSDTLCSHAKPLVAQWILRDTLHWNPKRSFYWHAPKRCDTLCSIKKHLNLFLWAFFFIIIILDSACSLPHRDWVLSHSCCAFQSTGFIISGKL